MLVRNKPYSNDDRVVPGTKKGRNLDIPHVKISAKTNEKVDLVFFELLWEICARRINISTVIENSSQEKIETKEVHYFVMCADINVFFVALFVI